MTYEITYASRTGNTAVLAEKIKNLARMKLEKEPVSVRKLEEDGSQAARAGMSDWIFAGFWVDRGDCSGEMIRFLEGLRGRTVFLFGTIGSGNPVYQEKVMNRVRSHLDGSNRVAGTFLCQGKMLPQVRQKFEAMLQEDPENENAKMRLANFERAMTHPDDEDLAALTEAVKKAFSEFLT